MRVIEVHRVIFNYRTVSFKSLLSDGFYPAPPGGFIPICRSAVCEEPCHISGMAGLAGGVRIERRVSIT